jgi:LacI family transcriptional regulator
MSKRVSLKDIADHVGVSTALVSYVMNGLEKEKRVGADVVIRIKKAAQELNYKPNRIAQSLRTGTTKTIGLIVADIANPFFGNLARVIEDEASNHGYTVIFGSSDEDSAKSGSLIDILLDRQVDGFIIVPAEGSSPQIKMLQENGVPLVMADRRFEEINSDYVILDNFKASYDAVAHLIENGHRRIGLIVYKSSLFHMRERIRGYVEAMTDHQLQQEIRVEEVHYDFIQNETRNCMAELISGDKKVDALLFATNALTISGLYCLKEFNIKVPEDIAIIGFDGNAAFDFFYTPLTYIEQPVDQMGKEAVRLLIGQINGSKQNEHVKLNHSLIRRKSSL